MMGVRPRVYLAGPMTGLAGNEMNNWRTMMAADLGPAFACLNPLRDKPFLFEEGKLDAASYQNNTCYWASANRFASRDEHDVRNADVIVTNLSEHVDGTPLSIGTLMEAGMARGLHTPLVVIMPESSEYNKSLLPEWATFVVTVPYQAADVVRSLFGK